MNRLILPMLAAAALGCATPAAQATTTQVSRCASSDGSAVYTDGSCRAIGAQVMPMSATLLRNLAREGSLGPSMQPAVMTQTRQQAGGRPRRMSGQCARNATELAAALRSSLSDGDVNQLASIYDWAGMSARQARPVLDRLERMSDRPLIDGHFFNTAMRDGAAGNENGVVQLVQGANSAPTVTELGVRQRAGCLFLAF